MVAHELNLKQNSGLAWYLDPGSIVIQLDDTSLVDTSSSGDAQDTWARYLLESHDRTDTLGWCLEYSSYQGMFALDPISPMLILDHRPVAIMLSATWTGTAVKSIRDRTFLLCLGIGHQFKTGCRALP
jgi:hypothetical protein